MQPRQRDDDVESNLDDTDNASDDEEEDVVQEEDLQKAVQKAVQKSLKYKKKLEFERALREAEKKSLKDLRDQMYSQAQEDILRLPKPGTVPPVSHQDKYQDDSSDVSTSKTKHKN